MASVRVLESSRQEIQYRLDSEKTLEERNKCGQFATPIALAVDILKYAKLHLPRRLKVRFLDPAFGTGAFHSALLSTFSASRIAEAVGYELDPHYGQKALDLWGDTPLELHLADFTQATPPDVKVKGFNLVICNPPYVRHHHLTLSEKSRLQQLIAQATGLKLSGLTGLYCYFLLLSHTWMKVNGLAGWLIPSEFMDVNYGRQVKQYLLTQVTLLRIHRFDPQDVQFGDALVSSAVVWFRKATPPANHVVELSYGGTLNNPKVIKLVPADALRMAAKWTRLPLLPDEAAGGLPRLRLSDLFRISRGVATGANDFFILTSEQVSKYKLPGQFLTPILPSPRYLGENEIESDTKGNPILGRKLFLLTCNLGEREIRNNYPSLWKYLQTGIEAEIKERYLCQHRYPWYAQEYRPASILLCTYMGRRDRPFRFVLNHSKATASNVYLMLYPKPALENVLQGRPNLVKALWQALNRIPSEALVGEGRVYGGGLHKMEPKELAHVPADSILEALPELAGKLEQQRVVKWADESKPAHAAS